MYEGLMSCHRYLAVITMIETPYGDLMTYGMLLDVARVVCDKSWVSNKNCYPFEYEPIKYYRKFDIYLTHYTLSK